MSAQQHRMHPLSVLHLISMFGLLLWWSLYFWHHTPARELLAHDDPTPAVARGRRGASTGDRIAGQLGTGSHRAASALSVAAADVAGGVLVLILFAVATGIYVRRFEIWLHARASGETVSFAGTDLDDKALAANTARKGRR
jgi:hypothetical protein